MYHAPEEILLRDGRKALLRSPDAADAAGDLCCMQQVFGETEFLLNSPEDVDPDADRHGARLAAIAEDPDALLLLGIVQGRVVARLHGFVKPAQKLRHRFRMGLAVLRECWGQGIASAMMAAAEDAARSLGATQMELEVMAHNHRAVRLYERCGYRIVMVHPEAIRFPDGRVRDEYLMIKKL